MKTTLLKRTFEASKHPKGSEKRAELNREVLTSEYMTSMKYLVITEIPETKTHLAIISKKTYRTKSEATINL